MKVTLITVVICMTGTVTKRLLQGLEDHPNYNIIKIGQNTEKRPVDLRRFVVSLPPVKNHQLTLVAKTLK